MRVLLVTLTEMLPYTLARVLNPSLEYCAIVVDDADAARYMFKDSKPIQNLIYPLYELKECIAENYFDIVICVMNQWNTMAAELKKWGLPKNKLIDLFVTEDKSNFINFFLERALKYFVANSANFEIFATGPSRIKFGLVPKVFINHKLFNFGINSQDLYYSYQIAKYILTHTGGGSEKSSSLKYVLIGMNPHNFNYDQSKGSANLFLFLQYAIAFNDLHNFWMPIEQYKSLFQEEFLNLKAPIDSKIDCVHPVANTVVQMKLKQRIDARERIEIWHYRDFPETRKEYIKILDDYLTLCESSNVRPIIVLPQVTVGYKKHFNKKMLDEFYYLIREAQKKHPSALFFDSWNLYNFPDADFSDIDHLNIQGAAKFSTMLNSTIEELERNKK